MFTGIIEEIGHIASVKKGNFNCEFTVNAKKVLADTRIGDSIAVNGVCLTVTRINSGSFTADVMPETLQRSSLGQLRAGSGIVNLERAVQINGRLGGHIVSGHIDGTGIIKEIKEDGNAVWYRIQAEPEILRYIIEKGSVAIDGISLTVAAVTDMELSVSVIPHTRQITALSEKKIGSVVNLENDCIGKYVEKFLGLNKSDTNKNQNKSDLSTGLNLEFLLKHGF